MKLVCCFAAFFLFGALHADPSGNRQIIEYQLEENQFAVVVVIDGDIDQQKAKELARERAAEITIENEGRYFTIVSEEEAEAILSDKPWPDSQQFNGNLYEELSLQRGFGRESLDRTNSIERSYPAVKLVFRIYEKRPRGKSFDARDF